MRDEGYREGKLQSEVYAARGGIGRRRRREPATGNRAGPFPCQKPPRHASKDDDEDGGGDANATELFVRLPSLLLECPAPPVFGGVMLRFRRWLSGEGGCGRKASAFRMSSCELARASGIWWSRANRATIALPLCDLAEGGSGGRRMPSGGERTSPSESSDSDEPWSGTSSGHGADDEDVERRESTGGK